MMRAPLLIGPARTSVGQAQITAGSPAHTKGSWIELIAALEFDSAFLAVLLEGDAAAMRLFDIGVGAAGDEQLLIANLHHAQGSRQGIGWALFPLGIPAGTRIAGRAQSSTSGDGNGILRIVAIPGYAPAPSIVDTFGADTSDSGGTVVDPGAVVNTYGAWVQMSAACPRDLVAMYCAIGNRSNGVMGNGDWRLQIGVGAAGDEQVIYDYIYFKPGTDELVTPPLVGPIPLLIPAGSRLAVRARSSITDATDRLFDVVLYGVAA